VGEEKRGLKPPEEPIPPEELEKPVEKLLEEEARKIYKERTGKEWEEEPPTEEEGLKLVREASRRILEKWRKGAKIYYDLVKMVFKPPEKPEYLTVIIGRKIKQIPILEAAKPTVLPKTAILRCPKCGRFSMKMIMPGIWQCVNCYHTLSIYRWYPYRRR